MAEERELAEFVLKELARGKDTGSLGPSTNLVDAGILDSLGIIKLILFLEQTYSVKVSDNDLTPENFESIQSIQSLIRKKSQGCEAGT